MLDREGDIGLHVQPMLAALSLGLLGIAVSLDVIGLAAAEPFSPDLATWDIAAGLAAGLAGGVAAILDLRRIPAYTGAFRIAFAQALLQGSALCLLGMSLILRTVSPLPSLPAILLAALGVALLVIARWVSGRFLEPARVPWV